VSQADAVADVLANPLRKLTEFLLCKDITRRSSDFRVFFYLNLNEMLK